MADILGYNMPDELYYHQGHCWIKVEVNDQVVIGLNEFFVKEAGEIVSIELPFEGEEIKESEACGKIQSSKGIERKIIAPISGEIMEINVEVEDDSSILNKDPYGEGWVMKVIASNFEDDMEKLRKGRSLLPWIKEELKKLKK